MDFYTYLFIYVGIGSSRKGKKEGRMDINVSNSIVLLLPLSHVKKKFLEEKPLRKNCLIGIDLTYLKY